MASDIQESAAPARAETQDDAGGILAGGGELGARMRAIDWSRTPLGRVDAWPQSLKTAVRIILTSRQPMFVWWSAEFVNLYNDPYATVIGAKHPAALVLPASQVWREIWREVGTRANHVMAANEGTYDESLLLVMERYGYPEETYFTFSYSPIPGDAGGTGGIIGVVTEDTQKIVGERQLALLRDLAARAAKAVTLEQACALSAESLATNPRDLPFAAIYLVDAEARRVRLAAAAGIEAGHPCIPEEAGLDEGSPWPFAEVVAGRALALLPPPDARRWAALPSGAWDRPLSQVALVPVAVAGRGGVAAVIVTGLSPVRLFDDRYRRFVELAAGQISASLANAEAYEQARRRAEALAEVDRAKTAFFSNVSHEFRTPLTLMLGPTDDALASPSRALSGEALAVVHRNGRRLLRLVNSLLDFSRIEAGRAQAVYEPVELSELTADVASAFRSTVERAGMRLAIDCPPLGEPVFVDRVMWEKVVLNLLSNAFKFTLEGEVEVSLRRGEDRAVLSVRDTGIGIPVHELPRMFERFHRVEGARGRTHEGTGIGLALIQELVRLHGGAISVVSEEGKGSTFSVSLPLGAGHLPRERVRASASGRYAADGAQHFVEEARRWLDSSPQGDATPLPQRLQPAGAPSKSAAEPEGRILVADDNADMRGYVARLLSSRWRVETAADGVEAVAAARAAPPDLVISDVMMPGLDGFGVLRALRDDPRTADVPVILLSARAGEESSIEGVRAGAADYLVKPFSARELLARVDARIAVARARARAAAAEKRARLEAEDASRAKDEFLAIVSHELRTPLTSMLAWTRLLRGGRLDQAAAARALETVERNASAQAQLIDDLLDVSRIVAGKLKLDLRPLADLEPVVRSAVEAVAPAARAKGIAISTVFEPGGGPLMGDADRLEQVVWNLVSNSVKFTAEGGVEVRCGARGGDVEVVVADTGQGISPSFLPHIFERFRQGEGGPTRGHGGLGLGLAIARHIVELHGGSIAAESGGEGRGAAFRVRLPSLSREGAAGRPTPRPPGAARALPSLDGARVLLVEDDQDTRDVVAAILEASGAAVQTCADAASALRLVEARPPDLLLSDIGLAGEDGYELVRKVRALAPERGGRVVAAALTAYANLDARQRALDAGYQTHIPKPVDPGALVMIAARLLAPQPQPS